MDLMWWSRADGAPAVEAPPLPPGGFIELPGRGTTFVRDARGPTGAPVLFLLHGLAATADLNWWFCYRTLARHFRVVAIDHRGHGHGIPVNGHFRLADCADDAVAVADALGIDRFIPVGYSMGGPITQLIWHRHPERVDGMVLCATSRDFQGSLRDWASFAVTPWLSLAARAVPSSAVLAATTKMLAGRGAAEPYAEWMLREFTGGNVPTILEAAAALGRFSSREWIGRIDVPVAVVATASDSLVPLRRQVKLALAIPSATLHVADGDHYLSAADRDPFVAVLDEACALVTRRARLADTPRRGPLGHVARRLREGWGQADSGPRPNRLRTSGRRNGGTVCGGRRRDGS
jgi:pimeloyl-ACP methyl ester carboxylesterase